MEHSPRTIQSLVMPTSRLILVSNVKMVVPNVITLSVVKRAREVICSSAFQLLLEPRTNVQPVHQIAPIAKMAIVSNVNQITSWTWRPRPVVPLALSGSILIPPHPPQQPTQLLVPVNNVTQPVLHVLVRRSQLVLVVRRDGSSLPKLSTDKVDVSLVLIVVKNVMVPVTPDVPSVRKFLPVLQQM